MRKMIYEPFGGLCNRLRNMDYVFQMKNDLNLDDFVLYWYNDRNCGCNLQDIMLPPVKFKNKPFPKYSIKECVTQKNIPNLVISTHNNFIHRSIYRKYEHVFVDDSELEFNYDHFSAELNKYLDENSVVYFRGCHNKTEYRDYSWLKFNQDLIDKAEKWTRDYPNYISLHIRRTDHKLCMLQSPTYVFFEFLDEILKANPHQFVYLASDDEELVKQAQEHYQSNMIPHPEFELSRLTKQGIRDAVVEFLIMARSSRIYGSFSSSYSEEAGYYGNIPVEMVTVNNYLDLAKEFVTKNQQTAQESGQ